MCLSSSSITSELFAVKTVEGEQLLDTTAISGTEKKRNYEDTTRPRYPERDK